jgi:protein subunit release factor A
MKLVAAALLLCFAAGGAQAQEVYRCGSAYSQTPCPQGRLVEADDSRSEAQRAEAARVAASERRLANEMRRDRLAEEAALKPALAGSLSAPKVVASSDSTKKKRGSAKAAAHKDFVVTVASEKKKRARS